MQKIAITTPYFYADEAAAITRLLRNEGYWRVHIRKPDSDAAALKRLIGAIDPTLYPRLTLHDHFEVAQQMELGGIHLNRRNPVAPRDWPGLVSRSLHTLAELDAITDYDYCFLSPIYPSISKPGYCGNFDPEELHRHLGPKVFALGGVTQHKFEELSQWGFGGATMLGNAWRAQVNLNHFRLQFITHPGAEGVSANEVEQVLRGGCRWIQLRHKDADSATLLREGRAIKELCEHYGATFIIDDHVDLVNTLGADGVHLGKNDMPVDEARRCLGPGKIIGATANTAADIERARGAGADYIGLGPYRFTTTKQKLSPVLGLQGYRDIIADCHRKDIHLPVVAIGGIDLDDIPSIMATGVSGIAISGTIRNAASPQAMTAQILQSTHKTI